MKVSNTLNRIRHGQGVVLRELTAWPRAMLVLILALLMLPGFPLAAFAGGLDSARLQEPGTQRHEVVFIGGDVQDIAVLQSILKPGQELHVLDAKRDGVAQMALTLAGRSDVDAIHLVSHGSPGAVHLGAADISGQTLPGLIGDLAGIGQALKPDGSILLYGCNVAQGEQGTRFVDQLASVTGRVVAASTDSTGASALGGNWTLEYATGRLGAVPLVGASYRHVLAPTTAIFEFEYGLPNAPQNTVTTTAFTNNGTNETMQLVSVGDGLLSYSVGFGGMALAGNDSLVSAGWTGMTSLTLSLQSGHKFDLTSFMEQEGSGVSGLMLLSSSKGSITFFVDGSSSINTRNVAAHPGAAYLQGITSVTLTYSGNPWMMVFDNIVLNNINPAPTVSGVNPTSGPVAGGTSVAITGANFTGATAVTFGGAAATGVTVNSDTSITATTPAGAAGAQDVVVTTAAGSGTGTGLFTYRLPPTTTTGSATSVSATGATLNGTVNDNGVTTTMSFEYGTTAGYGTSASAGTLGAGTGATPTAASISGLGCNTTYHFRVKGVSSAGTSNGSDATFTTSACVPGAPTAVVATAGNAQATITFTAPVSDGGAAISGYTATSNPSGLTGTCAGPAACPITVTGLNNGTVYTFTVAATNVVGTGNASMASNAITTQAAQTVNFNNPGPLNFGTTPTLAAIATSGLAVVFTSASTSVCTITSGGTLAFVAPGTCTINADQAGNAAYMAATAVQQSFTVNAVVPAAPTIGTATAGDVQALVAFTAPVSDGGASITGYTATCVSGDGGTTGSHTGGASPLAVSGLTNGKTYTCSVVASNGVGTGGASGASNAVMPKANQTITFANPGAQSFGTTPTLSASSTSGLAVTFLSSTTGVCTITSGGTLAFLIPGTCTIQADQAGNAAYMAATQVSQSFTVNAVVPGAPTIGAATAGDTQASVVFTPGSGGGATVTYTATCTSSDGGATGTQTAGTSPITVAGLTNGKSYTCSVAGGNVAGSGAASAASNTVIPKGAQTITFTNPGAQNFGTSPTLMATASSGLAVSFSSTSTSVCTVASGGVLTFLSTGTCAISANQVGNGTYLAAMQVSQSFTVNAVAPGAPTIGTASTDNAQSSVSFTAPAFNGGATIDGYTATCTSSSGGATGTNTGASSPIVVAGLTNGKTYTCSVTAHNSAGTGAASAASNTVTPAPGPAVLSVAVPANGSYRAGQNLDFTITWDQAATVTGTPGITLVIGATTVQAAFVSSPSTTTSLFRYTVLAGQTDTDGVAVGTLSLNGGTIRNAANTDAALTLNSVGSTVGVLVDTTAPTLPAANIVVNNQSDPHKLVLTFSEALASGSLGSAAGWTVTANGGSTAYTVASVALAGGNQITLTLSAVDVANAATTITNAAANAHLKVTPPASLTDVAGNTYAAGQVTEAGATHVLDSTAPTLSAVTTSGPTTSGGTLAATASEKALGYWIAVPQGATAPTAAQTQAGVNYGAVTVVAHGSGALPSGTGGSLALSGLAPSTIYDIHVVAQDAAGNLSAAAFTETLTTAAAAPPSNPFTPLPTPAPIPGINSLPNVIDMASGSGPAVNACTINLLRQVLGGDPVYLGQSASGAIQIRWNGQIISYYPLTAATTDARGTGIYALSSNPLDLTSSCGTLNVAPALSNPTEFGALLNGAGLSARINQQGVITVQVDGLFYVVRPDYVTTPGTPGAPKLVMGADSLLRFTDSGGNTQVLHPAVLDPDALQRQVALLGGATLMQVDGTVLMTMGGQQYVLTPDIVLSAVPAEFASLLLWQDGPSHYRYRVMTDPFTLYSQGVGVSAKPR